MKQAIQTSVVYSISVAICGTILLLFGAAPIVQFFIKDPQTVQFGQTFLRIICLACITTVINFMVITIFQATGEKDNLSFCHYLEKGLWMSFLWSCLIVYSGYSALRGQHLLQME